MFVLASRPEELSSTFCRGKQCSLQKWLKGLRGFHDFVAFIVTKILPLFPF